MICHIMSYHLIFLFDKYCNLHACHTHDVCHNLVIYLVITSPECRYDDRVQNCNHNYLAPPCPALLETEITVESGEDSQVGAGPW